MTFPTPYAVDWFPFTGGPSSVDELGNVIESWSATATSVNIQGWQDSVTERLEYNAQAEISDVVLSAPPGWLPAIRDRVALPGKGTYEVIGLNLQCNGFHGWEPGNLVLLKLAKGL